MYTQTTRRYINAINVGFHTLKEAATTTIEWMHRVEAIAADWAFTEDQFQEVAPHEHICRLQIRVNNLMAELQTAIEDLEAAIDIE